MTAALLHHEMGPHTVDDWLTAEPPQDGTRLELIWGYFHVSPAPAGQHQYAADELRAVLKAALSRRTDLYVVTAVAVGISTRARTGLVPDVVVLNTRPVGTSFRAGDVELAVEVWSPGNTAEERANKVAAYALAGVPFFWAVELNKVGGVTVTAHRLEKDGYVAETTAVSGAEVTLRTAPEPVTFDPADLSP
ncbi:Uma2 family endonuclease [Kutzneria albida]|uniref:Putative restriction endonuclease domain-containing protein n=1 Tax=Kutzneria albida DSM 43870 TaxID=1449976 RepID=W5W6K4_9PSEU|nr:Uma2 family endonuclease [Kutzneria albida]AHH93824.1 hypothetical protein KALB_447 [Kutzneria albida DSM 43870]